MDQVEGMNMEVEWQYTQTRWFYVEFALLSVQCGDHIKAYILCLESSILFAFLLFVICQQISYGQGMVEFGIFVMVEILCELCLLCVELSCLYHFFTRVAKTCNVCNYSQPMMDFMHPFSRCI